MSNESKQDIWTLKTAGALCCFAGGIGAGLLGFVLGTTAWALAEPHPWLHGLSSALLIITIPLLILSGFWLDWAESAPRKRNVEKLKNAHQR
jgi:hypothetical protein